MDPVLLSRKLHKNTKQLVIHEQMLIRQVRVRKCCNFALVTVFIRPCAGE